MRSIKDCGMSNCWICDTNNYVFYVECEPGKVFSVEYGEDTFIRTNDHPVYDMSKFPEVNWVRLSKFDVIRLKNGKTPPRFFYKKYFVNGE